MKNKSKIQNGKFQRSFNADICLRSEADAENKNRFELTFASEEPYERWYGMEILSHDDGAVELSRLNEVGVVLFNHDRDKVVGKVEKAWVEDGRSHAIIVFDDDEQSQIIADKVRNGTLKTTSVGYVIDVIEEVKAGATSSNGRFAGPCVVAAKWTPFEISIVSVPADPTVGVGRDLSEEAEEAHNVDNSKESNSRSVAEWDAIIKNNLRRVY